MGPLVPDIISNEFNLVIAFIIGIGFGMVLEQAGFSSTKKLVGLFYGYDFTVLRVFFTAGVTALIGVLLLSHFGLLDLDLIYINPTFLWSALVGGIIMGAGFIIGGFCPGTSVCAAAIGKIDGMAFVGGSFLGVLIFTEGYPWFEKLYMSENMGAVRVDQFLGISATLFAFILALIAIIAFFMVTQIEKKVNNISGNYPWKTQIRAFIFAAIPIMIIGIIAFTPSREEYIQNQISEAREQKKCIFHEINADKLAYEMVNNHYQINLIDVRTAEKFKEYHLPLAINIPLEEMTSSGWKKYFSQKHKINIFYADSDTTAKKACLLAKFIGKSENYILKENTMQFKNMFFNISQPAADASKKEANIYRFRIQAARDMQNLENKLKKLSQPVKKKVRKIVGGCS